MLKIAVVTSLLLLSMSVSAHADERTSGDAGRFELAPEVVVGGTPVSTDLDVALEGMYPITELVGFPVLARVRLAAGTQDDLGGGNVFQGLAGIEVRRCALWNHVCAVAGPAVGVERVGAMDGYTVGALLGGGFGLEAGGTAWRIRAVADLFTWVGPLNPGQLDTFAGDFSLGIVHRF